MVSAATQRSGSDPPSPVHLEVPEILYRRRDETKRKRGAEGDGLKLTDLHIICDINMEDLFYK